MDAHIRPNEAGCRVFVLTDADFMTIQAQNALLKLMEEPPDHVFLILTCADVQALLPTVRSRATVIPMEVLPPDRCAEGAARLLALRASGGNAAEVSPEERKKIAAAASFSGGSIGGTLAALEDQRLVRDGALLGAFFAAAAAGREYEMLRQLVPLEKDRERFIRLMGALKTRAVSTLSQSGAELSPEAAVRLARLADEAARTAAQNVTLAPLCAWLCRRAAG
jgi:DNA polymerase-3 subunit delta'